MGLHAVDPTLARPEGAWPWEDAGPARRAVFVCLEATGADPAVDGLFRARALRRGADGGWELYERFYLSDSWRMTALAYSIADKSFPESLVEQFLQD